MVITRFHGANGYRRKAHNSYSRRVGLIGMEWIWYIIASLGAGIGTGLAGLSAATVMVPILIVLCPSFSGETGAYQATAISLFFGLTIGFGTGFVGTGGGMMMLVVFTVFLGMELKTAVGTSTFIMHLRVLCSCGCTANIRLQHLRSDDGCRGNDR